MASPVFPHCKASQCPEFIISFSDACWAHTDQKEYLARLPGELKKIQTAPFPLNLKKVQAENINFSNLDLGESSFSQSNFSHSLFIGANLSNADMIGAHLDACDFVGGELMGANFTRARLSHSSFSYADLQNANFTEAQFREVDFTGAVLFGIEFWNADLSGAQYIKKKNFRRPLNAKRGGKTFLSEKNALMASESYRLVKHYLYDHGHYEDASWAAYRERIMERKHFFETKDLRFIPSFLMDLFSGYTEKPNRVIISSLGTVLLFGLTYYALEALRPTVDNHSGRVGLWDSVYFSFITFTTVGFGDFVAKPMLWAKALVSFEAFSGPFMAGLYIFTLTRKYAAN